MPSDLCLATYRSLLATTLAGDHGRFAVISGERLIGVFDCCREARKTGYHQVGLYPLLVRRIVITPEEPRVAHNHRSFH